MQKIFYNGKIYNGENDGFCDAILVNDGAIVFSGSNNEVLDLKNDETEVFDLNQKYVYPTFFACNVNLFNMIEERLKAQNKIDISKNSADNDENYEKFTHFDKYKKEFLNLQKLFIKNGITTIQEVKINRREFTFWKKIAELNLLKIDIAAYVDLISSKQVMDDNCVTYRKYKNHFRLGGYYIKIDGDLFDGKAWLSKPYKHTKFSGFGELYGEQLYFHVKTALEEKKQVIFDCNGDKAIDEVLSIFEEIEEKEKIAEFYRPIMLGAGVVNKSKYVDLKKFDFSLCFKLSENTKNAKRFIGYFRNKCYQNFEKINDAEIKFVLCDSQNEIVDILYLLNYDKKIKTQNDYNNSKKDRRLLLKSLLNYDSYVFFDQDRKGDLLNSMQANFIVLDDNIFNLCGQNIANQIKEIYISGEKETY